MQNAFAYTFEPYRWPASIFLVRERIRYVYETCLENQRLLLYMQYWDELLGFLLLDTLFINTNSTGPDETPLYVATIFGKCSLLGFIYVNA